MPLPKLSPNLLVLSVAVLFSCTYSPPEEENFKVIDVDENREFDISLNEFGDEIDIPVLGPTNFVYTIIPESGTVVSVEVFYDGSVISTSETASGTFAINQYNGLLQNGTHELKIQFLTTSGTGSLADKAGLEYYQVWRKWNIVIDIVQPPVPIPVESKLDGYLMISWEPFDHPSFVEYQVEVIPAIGERKTYVITDPTKPFVVIKDYVGGFILDYTVSTRTPMYFVSSDPVRHFDNLSVSGSYSFSDSLVMLTWSQANFYGDFQSYSIVENGVPIHEITSLGQTSISFKPAEMVYWLPLTYDVVVNAKEGYSPLATYRVDKPVETLVLSPYSYIMKPNSTMNTVFGYNNSPFWGFWLARYSNTLQHQSDIRIPAYTYDVLIPPEGSYLYYADGGHGVAQLNVNTQEVRYFDILPTTTGGIFTSVSMGSASGNQIVSFSYRAHNAAGTNMVTHVRVVDMSTNTTLYHGEDLTEKPVVSPDGRFVRFSGNRIFKLSNSQIIAELPSYYGFIGFKPGNNDEVLLIYNDVVYVYNINTVDVVRTINPPTTNYHYRGFDELTRTVLYAAPRAKGAYAIDITTSEQHEIKAYTENPDDFTLISGYLMHWNGDYMKAF